MIDSFQKSINSWHAYIIAIRIDCFTPNAEHSPVAPSRLAREVSEKSGEKNHFMEERVVLFAGVHEMQRLATTALNPNYLLPTSRPHVCAMVESARNVLQLGSAWKTIWCSRQRSSGAFNAQAPIHTHRTHSYPNEPF